MKSLLGPPTLVLMLIASPALASGDVGGNYSGYQQYGISSADCGNVARDQWMTSEAAKARAAELGYQALDISSAGSCLKVRGTDKNGVESTFLMHPVSGAIVKQEGRL